MGLIRQLKNAKLTKRPGTNIFAGWCTLCFGGPFWEAVQAVQEEESTGELLGHLFKNWVFWIWATFDEVI
jgi:hypothetical protein